MTNIEYDLEAMATGRIPDSARVFRSRGSDGFIDEFREGGGALRLESGGIPGLKVRFAALSEGWSEERTLDWEDGRVIFQPFTRLEIVWPDQGVPADTDARFRIFPLSKAGIVETDFRKYDLGALQHQSTGSNQSLAPSTPLQIFSNSAGASATNPVPGKAWALSQGIRLFHDAFLSGMVVSDGGAFTLQIEEFASFAGGISATVASKASTVDGGGPGHFCRLDTRWSLTEAGTGTAVHDLNNLYGERFHLPIHPCQVTITHALGVAQNFWWIAGAQSR